MNIMARLILILTKRRASGIVALLAQKHQFHHVPSFMSYFIFSSAYYVGSWVVAFSCGIQTATPMNVHLCELGDHVCMHRNWLNVNGLKVVYPVLPRVEIAVRPHCIMLKSF